MNDKNINTQVYAHKVELLLRLMPIIMDEGVFAVHGGTAINLFLNYACVVRSNRTLYPKGLSHVLSIGVISVSAKRAIILDCLSSRSYMKDDPVQNHPLIASIRFSFSGFLPTRYVRKCLLSV